MAYLNKFDWKLPKMMFSHTKRHFLSHNSTQTYIKIVERVCLMRLDLLKTLVVLTLLYACGTGVSAQSPVERGAQEVVNSKSPLDNARVFTARLAGSICPACLIKLEKQLRLHEGVTSARVTVTRLKMQSNAQNKLENGAKKIAEVTVLYNSEKLDRKKIHRFIHQNDFNLKDERDREAKERDLVTETPVAPDPQTLPETD